MFFSKYVGSGNDFILIDNRPKNIIPEAQKDLRNNKKFKIKK